MDPSVVVNCAAYTAVDRAEQEPEQAFAVNAGGAANLASAAAERSLPIIHLSTDYVYAGTGSAPHRESAPVAPLNVYGASKAAGDAAVTAANPAHLLLRVSWVFGVYGSNFVKTMLRLGRERPELRVVDDQRGGPTEARDIADAILVIAAICRRPGFDAWGIYHFAGAPSTSWHGFAEAIFARSGGAGPSLVTIATRDYPTPARAPVKLEHRLRSHPAGLRDRSAGLAKLALARHRTTRRGGAVKGIILAGGTGSRLWPITKVVSKQLLPVHDKPMIYYPLTTLMLAGIREILIITTPHDAAQFRALLGDGSAWGLELRYAIQPSPDGLAQAFLIGRDFIDGSRSALVLGDNLFYGQGFQAILRRAAQSRAGAVIFGYWVRDPTQYGVIDLAPNGAVRGIVEKPSAPPSNYAVTGLYFYDQHVCRDRRDASAVGAWRARNHRPQQSCTCAKAAWSCETLGRGFAWLDTGTPESLLHAAEFVATVEARQGLKIACPEEVAWRQNWIDDARLEMLAANLKANAYGRYLLELLQLGR